jgi:hypothetical protein
MIAINLILFQADIKDITMNTINTINTGLIMIHMETITKAMEATTILMEIIMTDMENIQNR